MELADTDFINRTKEYAEKVLSKKSIEEYKYHNLEHTLEVVDAVQEIGKSMHISDSELEIVTIAAWLHDVGYHFNGHNHEEESVKIAEGLLSEWGMGADKIAQVSSTIRATQMPQNPKDKLGEIICDADLYHLSTDQYRVKGELLRKEMATLQGKEMTEGEWLELNVEFFKNHHYFTQYGQKVLEPRKQKNLKKIKKRIKNTDSGKQIKELESDVDKLNKQLEKARKRPDRGIETMFRITSKNHLQLSAMADNKANIMISINSIILSVLVSVLFRKLEDYPNLVIPSLLLVTSCLITIVFAVLATRPNVSSGKFTQEDIMKRKTNLLFFGNFHGMQLDNYMWGMKEMMKDSDFLYGSLIKDIYFLGIVLGRKYRLLRISYTIFMFGFVISIIAFIISLLFFPSNE